uniref:Uncharacterized protein n=1 Tax=Anguilla anguilla TaxID=7936 RepID=A0A0E9WL97_ANGAN
MFHRNRKICSISIVSREKLNAFGQMSCYLLISGQALLRVTPP